MDVAVAEFYDRNSDFGQNFFFEAYNILCYLYFKTFKYIVST